MRYDPRIICLVWLLGTGGLLMAQAYELISIALLASLSLLIWPQGVQHLKKHARGLAVYCGLSFSILALQTDTATAALILGRFGLILTWGLIWLQHLEPQQLASALIELRIPPQIAWMIEGTLYSVKLLQTAMRLTIQAQQQRGITFKGWELFSNGAALIGPLVVQTVQIAEQLAETLEARGFSSGQRTQLYTPKIQRQDWMLLCSITSGLILIIIYR